MKKIIIAMTAMAAAFTMASCNKELVEPENNPTEGNSIITASTESSLTKTSLDGNDTDGYKVFWSEGDNLLVGDYWEEDWYAEFTLENSSAGSSKGIFKWNKDENLFHPRKRDDGTIYNEPIFETGKTYESIYPFSFFDFNEDGAAKGNTWKTEQTYADRYIPMYGKAECTEEGKADFMFKNLGGMLRLTVKGTATIRSITMHTNEPISGEAGFIEDAEGNMFAEIVGGYPLMKNEIILDCGTNGVELNGDQGTDFYISIPCHITYDEEDNLVVDGYSDVTITLTDTEGKTCVKKLSSDKKLVIERSKITTASFTASDFKANIPDGALPGKFTINENGNQVYFSQGNLWYGPKTEGVSATFNFETNQYDISSSWNASHVSNFYWSKTASDAYATYYSYNFSTTDVLFTNATDTTPKADFTVNGNAGVWRTLSRTEWQYLLANHTYEYLSVNGKYGIVIAPDGFSGTIDSYDVSDWAVAEAAGLVFLPSTGFRYDGGFIDEVSGDKISCIYWTSTANPNDEEKAYRMFFQWKGSTLSTDFNTDGYREWAVGIRLVSDCE